MDFTVEDALKSISQRFGPGFSNGVIGILAHRELPDIFDIADWRDWSFKPAPGAFDYAYEACFIKPDITGEKWMMTPFGKKVAAKVQADLSAENSYRLNSPATPTPSASPQKSATPSQR